MFREGAQYHNFANSGDKFLLNQKYFQLCISCSFFRFASHHTNLTAIILESNIFSSVTTINKNNYRLYLTSDMDEMEDIPLQEPNDILLNEYGVNDNNQQDAGPRPQDEETGNAELAGSAHTSTTKSQHLKFRINAIYLSLCNFAQESKQQISSHVRDIREKVLLATSSGGRAARSQLSKMKRKAVEARLVEDLVHSSTLFSSLVVVATSKWAEIGEEDNRTSKEEKRAEAWKWMFIA